MDRIRNEYIEGRGRIVDILGKGSLRQSCQAEEFDGSSEAGHAEVVWQRSDKVR